MSSYQVAIGLVVRHGEQTWRYEREVQDEKKTLVFADEVTGAPHSMTLAELQRNVLSGKLKVVTGDSPTLASAKATPVVLVTTLEDIPVKHRAEIERRYNYVVFMRRKGITRGQRRSVGCALEKLLGKMPLQSTEAAPTIDPDAPSTSTVMEWMRRWDMSGGNIAALMSRQANRRSKTRLPSAVIDVCRGFIRTHYCTRKQPPLAKTKIVVDGKLAQMVAAGAIEPNEAKVSLSTLQRLAAEISPFDRDTARFGASFAKNKWRYSLGGIHVDRPMQRYEIDHTIMDIVVISDTTGMPMGRPTLTIAVDSYSGYICGFFISFWGTGLASTMAALKVAISPKGDFTAGQKLEKLWLPYGIPMSFVVDNGLEFHSPQFQSIAMQLTTDVLYCAVRQPWLKPFVERALGAYLRYLPLDGRVEKPKDNYLPLKPEKTATATFSALCNGLLKAFVDIHPFEINECKLSLPYDSFSEGMARLLPPALPTSVAELDLIVAASKELTVTGEGIVSRYLRYNSVELQDVVRARRASFRTLVKFNPEDLDYVHVQDPQTSGWLRVPSCWPEYTEGLSLVQHKAIRARLKADLDRRQIREYLSREKLALIELWNSHAVQGKRLQNSTLRGLAGLTSSHILLPSGQTVSATSKATRPLLSKQELAVPAFQIPTFETLSIREAGRGK
jgi:putative transposase